MWSHSFRDSVIRNFHTLNTLNPTPLVHITLGVFDGQSGSQAGNGVIQGFGFHVKKDEIWLPKISQACQLCQFELYKTMKRDARTCLSERRNAILYGRLGEKMTPQFEYSDVASYLLVVLTCKELFDELCGQGWFCAKLRRQLIGSIHITYHHQHTWLSFRSADRCCITVYNSPNTDRFKVHSAPFIRSSSVPGSRDS